jgi:predicted aconitase
MNLTKEEEEMLDGGAGAAVTFALRHQIGLGKFFGAERFVPITHAHFMGDYSVMGDAGLALLEEFLSLAPVLRIPITRNSRCVSGDPAESRVTSVLRRLGIGCVDTCIPYQTLYQPAFGERLAWGDTGAVIYANSVCGARSNFESGPFSLFAAVTGRVPEYGMQLDDARVPTSVCHVRATLADVAEWGALGMLVGLLYPGYWSVPLFALDSPASVPTDGMKHLGASLASHGSMALFHIAGITPEAVVLPVDLPEVVVTDTAIDDVFRRFRPRGGPINLVVFTAPQLSYYECARIATLLKGRKAHPDVNLVLTINGMVGQAIRDTGIRAVLEDAGAILVEGSCWYLNNPAELARRFGWDHVVTNSAKLVNIAVGAGYEPILRRTEDCVEAAVTGRVCPA